MKKRSNSMTLKISADVEPLEAYKVYIDGDFEEK